MRYYIITKKLLERKQATFVSRSSLKFFIFLKTFLSLFFLGNRFTFAEWQRPEFKISNIYRYLLREQYGIYIRRIDLDFFYTREDDFISKIKLASFFELRDDLQRDKLEHKEAGLELGLDLVPGFYLGETLQYTRYNYDWVDYIWHPHIKHALESETRVVFTFPLNSLIKFYISDEMTYNFKVEEFNRNEAVLGLVISAIKYLEGSLDWRHIDRIHDFDSDALEVSLTLTF
jgi:hypothetical protein